MPNFPGSEQWMIGSGYELLVISSIGGPNLNELMRQFTIQDLTPFSSFPDAHYLVQSSSDR
jgi:hypothetical protein